MTTTINKDEYGNTGCGILDQGVAKLERFSHYPILKIQRFSLSMLILREKSV